MAKVKEEELRIEYVPLNVVRLWEDNSKKHNIPELIDSIEQHGFKDPPKYEPKLNEEEGGIVEGNGRITALNEMSENGHDIPRGIKANDEDEWLVPILFGVDALSEMDAVSYAVDNNNLVLTGAELNDLERAKIWEPGKYRETLSKLMEADRMPASVNERTLMMLADQEKIKGEESDFLDELKQFQKEQNKRREAIEFENPYVSLSFTVDTDTRDYVYSVLDKIRDAHGLQTKASALLYICERIEDGALDG